MVDWEVRYKPPEARERCAVDRLSSKALGSVHEIRKARRASESFAGAETRYVLKKISATKEGGKNAKYPKSVPTLTKRSSEGAADIPAPVRSPGRRNGRE